MALRDIVGINEIAIKINESKSMFDKMCGHSLKVGSLFRKTVLSTAL